MAQQKEPVWINSSNGKKLAEHGITCANFTVDRCMKELHDYEIESFVVAGTSRDRAKLHVEEHVVRQGYNRLMRPVWQIQESKIQLLKDWIEHDKDWISISNWDRMRPLGLTHSVARLDQEVADFARAETLRRSALSGEPAARLHVSRFIARHGETEQGNPTWQIHESAAALLRHHIDNPVWVNSHQRTRLAELGIVLPAVVIDPILKEYYLRLVLAVSRERKLPEADAEALVNQTMLREADSRYGKPSWDIKESFISELLERLPELGPRREEDWIPVASSRSLAMGIRAGKDLQERAAQEFQQQKVAAYTIADMSADDAKAYVESHIVKHAVSDKGGMAWKIHVSHMPEFKSYIDAMPHRDRYASRTGEGTGRGGRE